MPKVIACIILYYGAEYLEACIKAIDPFVDSIFILYTNHPTQGYCMDEKPASPDNGEEMKQIAMKASGKVNWVDVSQVDLPHEGAHRNFIYNFTNGFDIMMYIDADEIVEPSEMRQALDHVYKTNTREFGVKGFHHFWRSFDWVLTDHFRPIRFINLHVPFVSTDPKGEVELKIYHFGYCQKEEVMRFKFKTSGHHAEIVENYIDNVFYKWTPSNNMKCLHPVSNAVWIEAQPFDKNTLPDVLKSHPNFNKPV